MNILFTIREYPIHDPSPNDKNNALYWQLSDIYHKLAAAPLYSKAHKNDWARGCHPQKAGLPMATLEDPIAIRVIFPGFYNHAERRVPPRSNNPQDGSLATQKSPMQKAPFLRKCIFAIRDHLKICALQPLKKINYRVWSNEIHLSTGHQHDSEEVSYQDRKKT